MPQMTYISWNVQDFGSREKYRGLNSGLTSMIAAMAHQEGADIIFLMELKSGGIALLNGIRTELNRVTNDYWQYDFVKGAVRSGLNDNYIYDEAQLGFVARAHSEGYALFWRHLPNKFTMLAPAPVQRPVAAGGPVADTMSDGVQPRYLNTPAHALSLVMEGLPYQEAAGGVRWQWTPTGGYPNGGPAPAWAPLDFPPSNINLYGRHTPVVHYPAGRPLHHLRYNGYWRNANRRPAYCNVRLSNGTVVPIVCYHAPSSSTSIDACASGICLSSFSRQLYQYYDSHPGSPTANTWRTAAAAIISGDFNVDSNVIRVPGSVNTAYDYYTNAGPNGAGLTNSAIATFPAAPGGPVPGNNTILSLRHGIFGDFTTPVGGPPPGTTTDSYLSAEFDNIYYRGLNFGAAAPVGTRIDLLNLYDTAPYATALTRFWRDFFNTARVAPLIPAAAITTSTYVGRTPYYLDAGGTVRSVFPNIQNYTAFYDTNFNFLQRHNLSVNNRATFIDEFVSDHLPIKLRFNF